MSLLQKKHFLQVLYLFSKPSNVFVTKMAISISKPTEKKENLHISMATECSQIAVVVYDE